MLEFIYLSLGRVPEHSVILKCSFILHKVVDPRHISLYFFPIAFHYSYLHSRIVLDEQCAVW